MSNLKSQQSCYGSHDSTSSHFSERQSFNVYPVKVSGFRFNIKEWEIECLLRRFGDLTGPVKILYYFESIISCVHVSYSQKSSAEEAILKLDSKEFNGTMLVMEVN